MDCFREEYDLRRIVYAYKNLDDFYDKESQDDNKKQTKKFLEQLIIHNGVLDFKYKYGNYTNYGRRYSYGIQGIKREIRNFLLAGSVVRDYDLKSSHPCCLYYLCKKHNINTDKQLLKNYVFNKEEVIKNNFQKELFDNPNYDVKKLILTATNSDDFLKSKNSWLLEYQEEMKFIRDELKKIKDYKKILQDTDKIKQDKNNLNSSFVNRILCKVESDIIDMFVKITPKEKVFALMFDGLLVKDPPEDLLEDYNFFVKRKYGDYFNVVEKPIETDIEIPDDWDYDYDEVCGDIDSYETKMDLFLKNINPIKIINPPLYGVIQDDGTYEFYKKDAFIQATEHITYTIVVAGNEEKKSIVNDWLKNIPREKIYTHIITDPTYEGIEKYNLWRDWDIKNWDGEYYEDLKAVEFMRNHIRVLCRYNEEVASSIELWISHLLKYPKSKSFVPIFIGKQGTGKDMMIGWITAMIGNKKVFESTNPEQDIWGTFNPMMKNCFLIHLSEFSRKNTQDYSGKIKSISTSGTILINEKNKGQYTIESFHRFLGASNKAEPIPIECDNRRYLIIHTSPDKIGDTEYFVEGHNYQKDKNAIKSMYNYFMSLNPPENFKYHMIKETEYMEFLKDISRPQEECWLEYFVNNNKKVEKIDKFKTLDLYGEYRSWCDETKQSYKMDQRKFLIQLKVAIGNINTEYIEIKKSNGVMIAVFDWDGIQEEGKIKDYPEQEFSTIDDCESIE